jgi:hypothetical protein
VAATDDPKIIENSSCENDTHSLPALTVERSCFGSAMFLAAARSIAELRSLVTSSGADRDRTDDLRLAKPALSQLSYSPLIIIVGQGRLELPTSRLSGVRSNQLSYWP